MAFWKNVKLLFESDLKDIISAIKEKDLTIDEKVEKLINSLKDNEKTVAGEAKAKIQQAIKGFDDTIAKMKADIKSMASDISTLSTHILATTSDDINKVKNEIDVKIADMKNVISGLYTKLSSEIEAKLKSDADDIKKDISDMMDKKMDEFMDKVQAMIDEAIANMKPKPKTKRTKKSKKNG